MTFELLEEFAVGDYGGHIAEEIRTQSVLGACKDTAELAWLLDEMRRHGGREKQLLEELLLDAIWHDDAARVTYLLDRDVSPDTLVGEVPPLDVAHRIGAASVADILVRRGAHAKRHHVLFPRSALHLI